MDGQMDRQMDGAIQRRIKVLFKVNFKYLLFVYLMTYLPAKIRTLNVLSFSLCLIFVVIVEIYCGMIILISFISK